MPVSPESRRSRRTLPLGWFAAFVILPLGVWLAAAHGRGFEGKSLSNLSLEPLLLAFVSCVVFAVWALLAQGSRRPRSGVLLLILLSAAAFAVQHFVPGLRE
jgi:hypothetical protein